MILDENWMKQARTLAEALTPPLFASGYCLLLIIWLCLYLMARGDHVTPKLVCSPFPPPLQLANPL